MNEYHNGADPLYQIRTGGGAKYGATGPALQNLSKSTELISWWYGWDPTIPSDNAASVLFFNGTPGGVLCCVFRPRFLALILLRSSICERFMRSD